MAQWNRWCLGSARRQVPSPGQHSGLGIRWGHSCSLGCNCGLDLIPGQGNFICHQKAAAGQREETTAQPTAAATRSPGCRRLPLARRERGRPEPPSPAPRPFRAAHRPRRILEHLRGAASRAGGRGTDAAPRRERGAGRGAHDPPCVEAQWSGPAGELRAPGLNLPTSPAGRGERQGGGEGE